MYVFQFFTVIILPYISKHTIVCFKLFIKSLFSKLKVLQGANMLDKEPIHTLVQEFLALQKQIIIFFIKFLCFLPKKSCFSTKKLTFAFFSSNPFGESSHSLAFSFLWIKVSSWLEIDGKVCLDYLHYIEFTKYVRWLCVSRRWKNY